MFQELIPGGDDCLWTVGSYLDGEGRALGVFCGRKLLQAPAGVGTCRVGEAVWDADAVEGALRLLRELGFHGISQVEYKRDPRDGSLRLMEVNARLWQWHSLASDCGVDLVGDRLPRRAGTARRARRPASAPGDRRWVALVRHLRESRRDRLGLRATLAPLRPPFSEPVLSLRDPMPGRAPGLRRAARGRPVNARGGVGGSRRWRSACAPPRGAAEIAYPSSSAARLGGGLASTSTAARRRRRCCGGRPARLRRRHRGRGRERVLAPVALGGAAGLAARPPRPVRRRPTRWPTPSSRPWTRCSGGSGRPPALERRPGFTVVLTHDIDTPRRWTSTRSVVAAGGRMKAAAARPPTAADAAGGGARAGIGCRRPALREQRPELGVPADPRDRGSARRAIDPLPDGRAPSPGRTATRPRTTRCAPGWSTWITRQRRRGGAAPELHDQRPPERLADEQRRLEALVRAPLSQRPLPLPAARPAPLAGGSWTRSASRSTPARATPTGRGCGPASRSPTAPTTWPPSGRWA